MAKPFANAPQHNGAITDNYIVGLQIGRSIDNEGLQQMKYITIGQLKAAVTETLSAVFTFRGVYSSAVPDTPAVNDYFYCNETFTDSTQDIDDGTGTYSHTFYQNRLYAWNGTCWADITSLLPGNGIPAGGTTGQVLKKASGTDYDVEWASDSDLDTKNTAGATDSSSKLYIVGAPAQTANPQTYTQDTAYVGTDGAVYSEGKKTLTQVSGATLGDIPKFDSNGNIVDSGIDSADVLTESDVVNSVLSQTTDKPLSANMGYELQQEIDNLKARGRFLSLWNCTTGLPATNPQEMPYTYKAGDYYIVSSVGSTNYKPSGTVYSGTASSTQETLEVKSNDFYEFDGTNWILLFNTQKTVSFANIAGQPSDNLNLASALGGKVNTSDVYNALDQTAAGKVLDARQGKALNDAISDISNYSRRTRKNITNNLANLSTAIAEQNLEKYGYTIGDYFVGASGYTYHLADMDCNYGGYNSYAVVNTHHCGVVVDTKATSKWADSVTNYSDSILHSYLSGTVLNNIKSDFNALFGGWSNHLIARTELDNSVGGWGTIWTGLANCLICAMTEVQVYGSRVFGCDGFQTGTGSKPLELFMKYRFNEIYGNTWIWLKSLYSASDACYASDYGYATNNSVSYSASVSGLILFK